MAGWFRPITAARDDPSNPSRNTKVVHRIAHGPEVLLMPKRMPAIFFGHGNPMNALLGNSYTEQLAE